MTQREKDLFYEVLELLRKEVRASSDFRNRDWKDADDYIFSALHLTQGDIAEIYSGRRGLVYDKSAIEGFYPVCPSYAELLRLHAAYASLNDFEFALLTRLQIFLILNVQGALEILKFCPWHSKYNSYVKKNSALYVRPVTCRAPLAWFYFAISFDRLQEVSESDLEGGGQSQSASQSRIAPVTASISNSYSIQPLRISPS